MQKYWVFSSTNIYLGKCQTAWWQKRGWRANFDRIKFSSSPLIAVRKQNVSQLVQTSYIKRIKLFLFGHIINILLTELGRSVWENLDLGRWYRPHWVRSVLATYRPPARLIRTKYYCFVALSQSLPSPFLKFPCDRHAHETIYTRKLTSNLAFWRCRCRCRCRCHRRF